MMENAEKLINYYINANLEKLINYYIIRDFRKTLKIGCYRYGVRRRNERTK